MEDVGDTFLNVFSNAANAAIAARYQQPFELEKMKLEAIASGKMYPEGYPAGMLPAGVSPLLLLIAGGVIVYLIAKA